MAPLSSKHKAIQLFVSYSHKDEKLRSKLEEHLGILKRSGTLEIWHDRKITAGDEWAAKIAENLESSQIILLLITPSFISSDYCYGTEMSRALEKHESGEARVIPIILRSVDWSGSPFAKLQALPKDAKPVANWRSADEAWANVAEGIRKVCREIQESYSSASRELQDLSHHIIPLACNAIMVFLRERYSQENFYLGPHARFEVYTATDFANPMEFGISLFLHRVRQGPTLELDFILTAWARTAQHQHALAGWVMEQLRGKPAMPQGLMEELSPEAIESLGVTVNISPSKEDVHKIWKTITDAPFQVSVPYVANFKSADGVEAEDEAFLARFRRRFDSL